MTHSNISAYDKMVVWDLENYNTHYLNTYDIETLSFEAGERRFLELNKRSKDDFISFEVKKAGAMKYTPKEDVNISKMLFLLKNDIFPPIFGPNDEIGKKILLAKPDGSQVSDLRDAYDKDITLFGYLCDTARKGNVPGFIAAYDLYMKYRYIHYQNLEASRRDERARLIRNPVKNHF